MNEWYVYRNGARIGPFSFSELKSELGPEDQKVKIMDPSSNQWLSYDKFRTMYLKEDAHSVDEQISVESENASSQLSHTSAEDESKSSGKAVTEEPKLSEANLEPKERESEPKEVDKTIDNTPGNTEAKTEKNTQNLVETSPLDENLSRATKEPISDRIQNDTVSELGRRLLEQEPEVSNSQIPDNYKTGVNVWRRYLASSFDILLLSTIVGLVFGFSFPGAIEQVNDYLLAALILLLSVFIEPIFLSHYGHTPGKYLLSLKVLNTDGTKHSYEVAIDRTFHKFLAGYGLGIPIISVITMIVAASRYNKEGISYWDERTDGQIYAYPLKTGRVIAYILTFIFILFLIVLGQSL